VKINSFIPNEQIFNTSNAEAQTSLQLAVQVRNKIVEAIQEINRMQI